MVSLHAFVRYQMAGELMGAAVIPAYLDGTQRGKEMLAALLRPQRATLIFGPAMQFERSEATHEGLNAATARIEAAIRALQQKSDKLRQ